MKKLFLLLVLAIMLIGCEQPIEDYDLPNTVRISVINEASPTYTFDAYLDGEPVELDRYYVADGDHIASIDVYDATGAVIGHKAINVTVAVSRTVVAFYLYPTGPVVIDVKGE